MSESRHFIYKSSSANDNLLAGHYTQMIYSSASRIGCGFAQCSNTTYDRYFVCYYGEMVNKLYSKLIFLNHSIKFFIYSFQNSKRIIRYMSHISMVQRVPSVKIIAITAYVIVRAPFVRMAAQWI